MKPYRVLVSILTLLMTLTGCNLLQSPDQAVIGKWKLIAGRGDRYYEFRNDHVVNTLNGDVELVLQGTVVPLSAGDPNAIRESPVGHWSMKQDRKVIVTTSYSRTMTATLQGNRMTFNEGILEPGRISILVKLDGTGKALPHPTSESVLLKPLFDAAQVQQVDVYEDRWVYGPVTPIQAYYNLKNESGALMGQVVFSVREDKARLTRTYDIEIPAQATNIFLSGLASTPIEEGAYAPLMTHWDGYPHVTLTVTLPSAVVVFQSESQSLDKTPWKATINGKDYVVYSDTINLNWNLLTSYLARDRQKVLFEDADKIVPTR